MIVVMEANRIMNKPIPVLVIGYGSIGQRHAMILTQLGHHVAVVSQQHIDNHKVYRNIDDALSAHAPKYVVIANATAAHIATVQQLDALGYDGILLVEKPLSSIPLVLPVCSIQKAYVAYNLRFHPVIVQLRSLLQVYSPVSISINCGQHLSTWRPGRELSKCYSSYSSEGGGVLRDLSHELDYMLWLLGPWASVAALGGNFGLLGIEADEAWSMLVKFKKNLFATLSINYLDMPGRRSILVTTNSGTIYADLVDNTISINGQITHFKLERNDTYTEMHKAAMSGDDRCLCTIEEALNVNKLISAVEESARIEEWTLA